MASESGAERKKTQRQHQESPESTTGWSDVKCPRCGGAAKRGSFPPFLKVTACDACFKTEEARTAINERLQKQRDLLDRCGIAAEKREKLTYQPLALIDTANVALVAMAERNGIVRIFGPTGTGKTTCAMMAVIAACGQLIPARFETSSRFVLRIQDAYRRGFGDDSVETILDSYVRPRVLALDDLAVEGASKDATRWLLTLIEERVNRNNSTIITTNLPLAQIDEAYGDRLASRLAGGTLISLTGPDHRLPRKESE